LVVALDHAHGLFIEPHIGPAWTAILLSLGAHCAVMLFFVISGYMITMSILGNIMRNGRFSFQEFLISRLVRIYPPLFYSIAICILFLFCIYGFGLPGSTENPYHIGAYPQMRDIYTLSSADILNALKMNDGLLLANGPLWSLFIEFWIYAVAGLTVFLLSARRMVLKIAAGFFLFFCIGKLFEVNAHSGFYLGIWLSGALIAVFNRYAGWFKTIHWKTTAGLLVLTVLIGSLFPDLVLAGGRIFGVRENLMQFLIVAFWASLALPTLSLHNGFLGRSLHRLGDCSYTLYITHFPILLFVLSLYQYLVPISLMSSVVIAFVALSTCVLISLLSAPFLEDKKMFSGLIEKSLLQVRAILIGWPRSR